MSRVLLVSTIFPPQIGGPATFIDRLGHTLSERGHKVTVVCVSDASRDPADAHRPFRVRRIRARNSIGLEILTRAVLAQEMLRHRHILVIGLDFQAYQIARALRRSYVIKVVGDVVWERGRNLGITELTIDEFQGTDPGAAHLRKMARKRDRFLRQAQLVITPSEYLRQMVASWGIDDSRISTVLNGVPLQEYSRFQPSRRRNGPLEVAFCGRLTNWKGVETLLLAASAMPNCRIHIMGDGPALPMLVGLSKQLGMADRVRFYGRLQTKPMQEVLSSMHALVLTSAYEGLSHTLLEASAMGIPCVASDCGGNPEVIRAGENGLLVPYGDAQRLRSALESMQEDEEYRCQLARNAKENSARFDFALTVNQVADLLLKQQTQDPLP